jgi:hypothetical protein
VLRPDGPDPVPDERRRAVNPIAELTRNSYFSVRFHTPSHEELESHERALQR